MDSFKTDFWQWADVFDVDEVETMIVWDFLDRVETLPLDEREAVVAVLTEIGAAQAAQVVDLTQAQYLEWRSGSAVLRSSPPSGPRFAPVNLAR